jgi:hypothetical protein
MSAYQPLLLAPSMTSGELRVESRTARLFHGMLGYLSSGSLTCRHRRMSRPFTNEGETYCVCLRCGMQRAFDLDVWKMKGSFYNDSRRTARSMATNERHDFHDSEIRRPYLTEALSTYGTTDKLRRHVRYPSIGRDVRPSTYIAGRRAGTSTTAQA